MHFWKTFLLFLLMGMANVAFAQSTKCTIDGVITDKSGPLPFVQVWIENLGMGAVSNSSGYYSIADVPEGKYKVHFSLMGYDKMSLNIELVAPKQTVDVQLAESSSVLNEVVVSGTLREVTKLESPIPVEVYSKAFFCANPSPSVFESVQYINGVRPQVNCNICNTGDIHINGLEGPYTMVLIDGMPIVSGLSTVYGLMGIPQSMIERIEVVKGPASTMYGSEAVGGLINIITVSPEKASKWSAEASISSWLESSLDLGKSLKIGKSNGLLGISAYSFNRPTDHNGDGFTDIPIQNRVSIFNKWSIPMHNGKQLSLAGRYFTENRWGGQMHWTPEFFGGDSIYGESISTNRWELLGSVPLSNTQDLMLQWSANGHEQHSAYGANLFNAQQIIGFGQMTWHKEISSRHLFLAGLAYRYTYYDDNTSATYALLSDSIGIVNSPSVIHLPGIFVQDEWKLNEKNTLLVGLRTDYQSVHGLVYSPRIAYKWKNPLKNQVWRLNAGNGFRVVNIFTEDHAALTGAREVIFEENLNPEQSWNVNLNWTARKLHPSGTMLGIDVSVFYTHFSNRILPDYDSHPDQIIYRNLHGYSVSRGLSVNGDLNNNRGFTASAGFTLQDIHSESDGVVSTPILTEKCMGVWNIGYMFDKMHLKVDYTGNVIGPMRLPLQGPLDPRDEYSPWWSIQNVQFTWSKVTGVDFYLSVKNLLNLTPPANAIARPHDPFDKQVEFDQNGLPLSTAENPYALSFDPSYVFASNQGIRILFGVRIKID